MMKKVGIVTQCCTFPSSSRKKYIKKGFLMKTFKVLALCLTITRDQKDLFLTAHNDVIVTLLRNFFFNLK